MSFKKYKGAVSDTDILINLGKAEELQLLFEKIIIPQKILDEMLKNEREQYTKVFRLTNDFDCIFIRKDKTEDRKLYFLSRDVIEHYNHFVGPGEAECAGYASALGIDIIISDNYTEFQYMDDQFIMLTHRDLLFLCIEHQLLSKEDAKYIFEKINQNLKYPSSISFEQFLDRSFTRIYEKGWSKKLALRNL